MEVRSENAETKVQIKDLWDQTDLFLNNEKEYLEKIDRAALDIINLEKEMVEGKETAKMKYAMEKDHKVREQQEITKIVNNKISELHEIRSQNNSYILEIQS